MNTKVLAEAEETKLRENPVKLLEPVYFCIVLTIYALVAVTLQFAIFTYLEKDTSTDFWFVHLGSILFCYGLLFFPIWILRRYSESLICSWEVYTDKLSNFCRESLTVCFLKHYPLELPLLARAQSSAGGYFGRVCDELANFVKSHRCVTLVGCAFGLNSIYVIWGILQEKIMTRSYAGEPFRDPQFLVFINRVGGLCVASVCLCALQARSGDRRRQVEVVIATEALLADPPLVSYANPALSNILSSWCQYEALLFVTFPVQVISKSCKAIPVMLMGRLLYGRSYKTYEYVTNVLISVGVSIFILASPSATEHSGKVAAANTASGLVLICAHIVLDSFTSTYQDNLFRTYGVSPLRMMRSVCGWALLFTITPLLADGSLGASIRFAWAHPQFALDASASAACSGLGQVLIFATIAEFGAVTFTIVMTVRQCFSIVFSCLLFDHPLSSVSALGLALTFGAIFARIAWKRRITRKP